MNNTQKDIKNRVNDCKEIYKKLDELHRLLLGLNAFGSLKLKDYNIITDYIKGSFNYNPQDNNDV